MEDNLGNEGKRKDHNPELTGQICSLIAGFASVVFGTLVVLQGAVWSGVIVAHLSCSVLAIPFLFLNTAQKGIKRGGSRIEGAEHNPERVGQFFALLMGLVGIGAGTLVGLQSAPWPGVMITLPPLVLGYMFIYKHSGYDEKKINDKIT